MVNWNNHKSLISDIARRRVIIVIGSGVSRHSTNSQGQRPPLWKEFLENSIGGCPDRHKAAEIEKKLRERRYLQACEDLKNSYDERWIDHLRSTFATPGFKPAPIHEKILALDSRVVFSLNFDDIYERHANAVQVGLCIIKNYYDEDVEEFLRGNYRYIIKFHGNMSVPGRIIFTEQQYNNARTSYKEFYKAFEASLLSNTLLFIGAGEDDPDINLIMQNFAERFRQSRPHYFLTGDDISEDGIRRLRQDKNLVVLKYNPSDEYHSNICDILEDLVGLVEEERQQLTATQNW